MSRFKNVIALLILASSVFGCLNLDDTLFNPDNSLTEYKFEESDSDYWNFTIDDRYDLDQNLIEVFPLQSQTADESEPTQIYAVYIGDMGQINSDTVIVYSHGNGAHMDAYWQRIKLLANAGGKNRFGVLAYDYRGYGLSEGSPSEAGLYADLEAALAWLQDQGLTGDRLVLYGYSMGCAPSIELTAKPRNLQPSWLMAEAPFASADMMVSSSSGANFDGSWVTNLEVDNAEEITTVDEPFYWIHGTRDDFIDFEAHGQVVFDRYQGSRGVAIPVEGADHGDVPIVMGVENYLQSIEVFITGE